MSYEKSEHCSKCEIGIDVSGGKEHSVAGQCSRFRDEHRHNTVVWVAYSHDMGVHISAVFDNEIDALRYAVGSGYLKVAALEPGEIGNLP